MKPLFVAVVLVILVCVAYAWPIPDPVVPYPSNYREWTHVKSALIDPKSPTAGRYGGIHHIYANQKAMEGYRTGKFADGSIIVFDLFETRESAGITAEGPRKFIDVMMKDSQRYSETGGWGYEEFANDNKFESALTAQARTDCYNCHARQKSRDYVFSTFRQ